MQRFAYLFADEAFFFSAKAFALQAEECGQQEHSEHPVLPLAFLITAAIITPKTTAAATTAIIISVTPISFLSFQECRYGELQLAFVIKDYEGYSRSPQR